MVRSAGHGYTMEFVMLPCDTTFMKFDAAVCCEMGGRHRFCRYGRELRGAYQLSNICAAHCDTSHGYPPISYLETRVGDLIVILSTVSAIHAVRVSNAKYS